MGGCLIACEGGARLREDALLHVVRRGPFMGGYLITCGEGNSICGKMPYCMW